MSDRNGNGNAVFGLVNGKGAQLPMLQQSARQRRWRAGPAAT
jgi:hypothetical protein